MLHRQNADNIAEMRRMRVNDAGWNIEHNYVAAKVGFLVKFMMFARLLQSSIPAKIPGAVTSGRYSSTEPQGMLSAII